MNLARVPPPRSSWVFSWRSVFNARRAAEQFAKDSNSQVGTIRRATQGAVEINDRDSSSPHRKIIRIVTTVDYFLQQDAKPNLNNARP
jgi:hypothetical protein